MPDHLVAALAALVLVGCFLAGAVRTWWTAPVVEAIDRLRRDTNARLDGAYEADHPRKDRAP